MQYKQRSAIYQPTAHYNRAPGGDSAASITSPSEGESETAPLEMIPQGQTGDNDESESEIIPEEEPDSSEPESVLDEIKEHVLGIGPDDNEEAKVPGTSNETSAETEESTVGESSPCYVIVGAFGVSSNVDRMIERLAGMGYDTATMPSRGLTQVGVPARCDSHEINSILRDLQTQVEAQAWILNQ